MEVTLKVTGENVAEIATTLVALGQALDSQGAQTTPGKNATRGVELRNGKGTKAAAEEPNEFEIDNAGEGEADVITEKELTLAFRKYAKENSSEEAAAILKKLKVKKVADIPEEKYASVMRQLNS